ncbi:MAG TPA: YhdH/YhfP family quinone oxidoreductase [Gallionellaceae bacterium]|nr:YhdH/YhfP family quinone oxidoreductase [Gallionellaceae bacterium]
MSFRAYRIFEENGKSAGRLVNLELADLDPGEVVIRTRYSSVNYKDALAATGAGKIIRRIPCVGGVDAAGVVETSSDDRFKAGDEVVVTGYGMGVSHDGGFAEYVRVPADWAVPLPDGLTLLDAMALGTAGFTAALAIHRLEQNELAPERGKVVVTGATGGVGSLAVQMLAQLGYHVVAVTGKDSEHAYLRELGAAEILPRAAIDLESKRPLESAQWAGALDAVGGPMLAWLLRTMAQDGAIASFGNAGGVELHTSVFPFILRGVKLLGVDSAATDMPLRRKIWRRLATDLRPAQLTAVTRVLTLGQLPETCQDLIQGRAHGRNVIDFLVH